MWSRYTVSAFINRKKPANVIEALMKNWVGILGVRGALISDNGGELSSDEMREVASILNVKVCTTAGMSPYHNGLCERVHTNTDIMLIKLEAKNKNVESETLFSWANMARNSLQMWNGFSSHQLVFDSDEWISASVLGRAGKATGGNKTLYKVKDHISEETKKYRLGQSRMEYFRRPDQ
ncbi:unnamed protein product [Mytilus coruscus]|uniref:Integrase catalytic domain-containing protein n=1 Tax=Mytilus coruscus TaxID=42192 RepID=A0A6J8C9N7_MYTCO|nr:unnamed protein product [Mytilus coruscus]